MITSSYSTYSSRRGYRFSPFSTSSSHNNGRMKVYYMMDYLPSRYDADYEQQNNRRAIYDFKDGDCPSFVLNGLARGINRFANGNTVVCFVPSSSGFKTRRRYAALSRTLSERTGVPCSYTAIYKDEDSESGYIGGKSEDPSAEYEFDSSFFSGKKVILIDDVMTRGRTLLGTARRLKEHGAAEVVGMVVGMTMNPDWDGPETRNIERL